VIEFSSLNTTSSHSSTTVNKKYHIASTGFQMFLPEGWNGVDNQNIAMVSPAGMNLKTGALEHNGDKVMMVIQGVNTSDFLGGLEEYRV